MGIAVPLVVTAIALPASAVARLGLAYLIGVYCGVTRTKCSLPLSLIDASNVKVASFVASAAWVAWIITDLV